ncbi:MAG: LemA family protein [Planctomycetaceae bacterium]|nr:LemA family protein [Planctomycetaceae bacterium]
MIPTIIGLAVLVVLGLYAMSVYNGLVSLRNRYKNAFAQVDVQLKRRYDLIPNLVETAKGYMKHESETLEKVVNARSAASGASQRAAEDPADPNALQALAQAESRLAGALRGFHIQVEAYPDLKANTNMLALQEELTATENRVSFARQSFNDAVTAYNTRREVFPACLFAGMFGFQQAVLFEVEVPEEREAVRVSF